MTHQGQHPVRILQSPELTREQTALFEAVPKEPPELASPMIQVEEIEESAAQTPQDNEEKTPVFLLDQHTNTDIVIQDQVTREVHLFDEEKSMKGSELSAQKIERMDTQMVVNKFESLFKQIIAKTDREF